MSAREPSTDELLDVASAIAQKATELGATDVEVFAEHATQIAVNIEASDIKGASIDEHRAVGIRVLVGDREGFAYANRLDPDEVKEAVSDAIAIARASHGDDANGLVSGEPLAPPPGLFDGALAALSADACVRFADEMLAAAKAVDPRVRADGSFSCTAMRQAIVSTRGVRAYGEEAVGVYGLHGMAVDGDDVGSFDHVYEGTRRLDAIDAVKCGRRFGEKVITLLKPVDGTSYKGRVLLSADAFEEIFLDGLLSALDGDAVHKGRSRLKEKRDTRIAPPGFTLLDDGSVPGGYGSGAHDREGLPHRPNVLVEDGVLRAFLYDGKAARRAGATSTANASGSARATPHIGTTNVIVGPGATPEADLRRLVEGGLFVGRFSGNVDGVSGDFSGVAKGSFLVEDGACARPVKETLIAGNVFDLLPRIVAIGDTLHGSLGTRAPFIVVDGVDVTAGTA